MSCYYLCDDCRHRAGSAEMKNYCCLAPGMARITLKTRKAVHDGEEPREVCRLFENKEVKR